MPFLSIKDDLLLHYLDFPGKLHKISKPPVVLLHGLGAHAYSWMFQFPPLVSAGYRVLAPDFRGFGASVLPPGRLTIQKLENDIFEFLELLEFEQVILAGISLGGLVGLSLAIRHPERIERLILINSAARVRPDSLRTGFYYARRLILGLMQDDERQATAVSNQLFPGQHQENLRTALKEQILAADPRAYRDIILSIARFDVRRHLMDLILPALVITGMQDNTINPRLQLEMAELLPESQLVRLSGAGHAVTVEQPDQVNRHILEFVS